MPFARLLLSAFLLLPLAAPRAQLPPEVVQRRIGLADLGFPDGVALEGLGTARELFFPLPRGADITGATLALRLESRAIFEGRRGLEVVANGRSLLARPLPAGGGAVAVDLPLTPEDLARGNGFLRVTLKLVGALTEDRCLDQRLAGERLDVLPGTGLTLAWRGAEGLPVGEMLRLLPHDVTVVTPAGPLQPGEAAAALAAAHALAGTGRRVAFAAAPPATRGADGTWIRGLVTIQRGGEGARIAVVEAAGAPALAIAGAESEAAARLLGTAWREAAIGREVAVQAAAPVPRGRAVPLAALRGDLAAQDVVERGSWTLDFSLRDLPAGTRPTGLSLDLAAAQDGRGERPSAVALLNEAIIASASLGGETPARLRASIPDGLVGLDNRLRVIVQRRPSGGDCAQLPVGLPAQILPSSTLLLADTAAAPADFHDLSPRFREAVRLLLPAAPSAGDLAPLLSVLRGQVAPGAAISVAVGLGEAPTGPFIALAGEAPGWLRPTPLRFDRGRVTLADREGRTLFDITGGGPGVAAQLVATSGGTPGLWLRPAAGGLGVPEVLSLDRGDVAIADARGIAFAWASGRDALVRIAYPDQTDVLALLARWRPWLIAGAWLAVTALLVGVFARSWRRRRGGA